jgi:hypothetical protein
MNHKNCIPIVGGNEAFPQKAVYQVMCVPQTDASQVTLEHCTDSCFTNDLFCCSIPQIAAYLSDVLEHSTNKLLIQWCV